MAATIAAAAPAGVAVHAPDPRRRGLTIGVSGLYLALYLHYGYFAFIPLWLKNAGASAAEIGMLLAIPLVLRLLTVAPFSAWAGRRGRVRDAIVVTALASAGLVLLLLLGADHAGRIAIVLAFSIMWDQLPVLTDAYAVMAVRSHGVDFGRVRVWGSIAAVLSTGSAGWVLGLTGISALPVLVAALLVLPALTAPLLPPDRSMAAAEAGSGGHWRDLIGDRQLMRALLASALIMGSHGVITNFGAIQWSARGISTGMIGTLQAVAVSVEIVAFWFGARFLGDRDPMALIVAASVVAVARWSIMACNPGLPLLFATQLLHGVTSTGAILGTMLVIARRVPVQLSATAQGLNAVLLGVALAIVTAGSGLLWSYGTAAAYGTMAAIALAALILAWLGRRPRSSRPPVLN